MKVSTVLNIFYSPSVQAAMRKAEAVSTKECPVKIKLVAPPTYVLTTQTLDKVIAYCSLCTYNHQRICFLYEDGFTFVMNALASFNFEVIIFPDFMCLLDSKAYFVFPLEGLFTSQNDPKISTIHI